MNRRGARLRTALYWILPPLVCLLLYGRSFRAWFRADDFAWLSAGLDVHGFRDLLGVLFAPAAQGTIRPWSEPAFFMAGYKLFGLNAIPFRIVVFATQFLNLALVASIGVRLAGMRAAGLWAALLWVVNGSLVEPLGWTCTYNQVMCGSFLLLAFYFLLRQIETGDRRYYTWQWVAFLLGFGALETNVVYPVLAMGYTWLCARKYFRNTLPMAAVSAAYAAVHLALARPHATGTYAMHFGASMLRTLGTYWTWSVGPTYLYTPLRVPDWALPVGIGLLTVALFAFLAVQVRQGRNAALFCLLWYVAVIAPVLPLRDHLTEYYVFLPLIGVCWLAGWAMAVSWRSGAALRSGAAVLAGIYALMAVPEAVAGATWNYRLTGRTRALVQGVGRAHELYPGKTILLEGMDNELFANSMPYQPFRLVGANDVYLAPGSGERTAFELPANVTAQALDRGQAVVYDVRGPRLRNITELYRDIPREAKPPALLDAAVALNAHLLGPEWYPVDEDHRWMPRRATFQMAAPDHAGERLWMRGGTTRELLAQGPLVVTVAVDGISLPPVTLHPGEEEFQWSFPLPDAVVGKPEMRVSIETSRAFRAPGDRRELSLHFGTFEVK